MTSIETSLTGDSQSENLRECFENIQCTLHCGGRFKSMVGSLSSSGLFIIRIIISFILLATLSCSFVKCITLL